MTRPARRGDAKAMLDGVQRGQGVRGSAGRWHPGGRSVDAAALCECYHNKAIRCPHPSTILRP